MVRSGKKHRWNSHLIISHEGGSERREGVSEVSEQINESAVQANERTDEQMAQCFLLGFWLIWPTVQRRLPSVATTSSKNKSYIDEDLFQAPVAPFTTFSCFRFGFLTLKGIVSFFFSFFFCSWTFKFLLQFLHFRQSIKWLYNLEQKKDHLFQCQFDCLLFWQN